MFTTLHYAAFGLGFTLAGILAGAGGWAYDNLFDDPALVRETKADCAVEASRAAMEATVAQWARSQKKIDEMTRQFEELSQRRMAEEAQISRELDDDIADFEAAGRSQCAVTADNIDWLQPGTK